MLAAKVKRYQVQMRIRRFLAIVVPLSALPAHDWNVDGYNEIRYRSAVPREPSDDPRESLPLLPAAFQILVALADQDRHGYEDDERRRYYRLTRFGREVAKAEADRLTTLLRQARAAGLTLRRSTRCSTRGTFATSSEEK